MIVVTGAKAGVKQLAVGPGQSFSLETLEGFPSINRDIRDIIRLDSRVSLDRANEVDRISCLGGNDRSNVFTVDGVVQADVFGLNGFTVDGRPILRPIDPLNPGCNADLVGTGGTPPTFNNVTAACFGTGLDDFIQLTNGSSFDSHVASFSFSKRFNEGVFTSGGSVNVSFGYAFTDSNNFRNTASSTATSSFDVTAAADR